MKLTDRFDTRTAFIDMLLSGQMNLFVLFLVALALIRPDTQEKSGVDLKAEYIIKSEWTSGLDCDVDLWVRSPTGELVYFVRPNGSFANLERDDLGQRKDTIQIDGETVVNNDNTEYVVIRKVIAGEYVVNVHLYNCDDKIKRNVQPFDVMVTLQKINPRISTVVSKKIVLERLRQEAHAFRFSVDQNGTFLRTWDEPVDLVSQALLFDGSETGSSILP